MSGQAAYKSKLQVSTDDTVYHDIPATSPSFEIGGDVIDTTELKTNAGYRTRINGLHDCSVTADANFLSSDPALIMLLNAKTTRTPVYIRYYPDASDTAFSLVAQFVVETFGLSGDTGGLVSASIPLQGTSDVTVTTP